MDANRTPYVYKRELTAEEDRVQNRLTVRYPYVSTITLKAGDPLTLHLHHSANTHSIVKGSLFLGKMRLRPTPYKAGDEIKMQAGVKYQAKAGDDGCIFVEGHTVLSPKTADRFVRNGTIAGGTEEDLDCFYVVVPQE